MKNLYVFLVTALVAGSNWGVQSFADEKCPLQQYASLNLGTDPSGGVYVPAGVNGRSENLIVDTGGMVSMLTESTVNELALSREPINSHMFVFMPGARITEITQADSVQLGTMKAGRVHFLILPDRLVTGEVQGTLAPDFLANYDVELDFVNAKFNLFSQDHCPGQVVYWTHEPFAQIPFQMDRMGHMVTTVQLDEKSIDAIIDTGASQSIMGFEAAKSEFGWDDKTPDLKVGAKRPDGTPANYRFPFKTLTLAGLTVNNPDILLVRQLQSDDFRIGSPKMRFLIGMSVLRQLHMYIAYKERVLYVTGANAH